MFHALYNFEEAKEGVQNDFAEAKKIRDRALSAYEEEDLPGIQERINFLKNIRRKFNADEENFKGYETNARKLRDTITDNNKILSEQKEEELTPVISELEKQKLDTAIRWANNLGAEIQNVLKLIIKSKNE